MKVRALAKGYDGKQIREAGDVFDVADGTPLGKWMEPVEAGKAEVKAPAAPAKPAKGGKSVADALADAGDDGRTIDVM